jgi:two-component system chemotaxis sensor kinase CheA
MSNIEKLRDSFLTEVGDLLADIEQIALELERTPDNSELIKQLFRDVHTLKGSAGMFGYIEAEGFLHQFEYFLDSIRSGKIYFQPEYTELVLSSADLIRNILFDSQPERFASQKESLAAKLVALSGGVVVSKHSEVQQPKQKEDPVLIDYTINLLCPVEPDDVAFRDYVKSLQSLGKVTIYTEGVPPTTDPVQPPPGKWTLHLQTTITEQELHDILDFADESYHTSLSLGFSAPKNEAYTTSDFDEPAIGVPSISADFGASDDADIPFTKNDSVGKSLQTLITDEERTPADATETFLTNKTAMTLTTDLTPARKETSAEQKNEHKSDAVETSVKIHIDVLEKLMSIVSELVLNRNQLLQVLQNFEHAEYIMPIQQLNRLTTSLQEAVMQTRMQPIGSSWAKLPRMVRDTAHELGKQIELVQTGANTELDRQIIQIINEPLIHLVRNSVDHGIELPARRVAAGKPEQGTVKLNAHHEAGQIVIEISDDGAGIDPEIVRKKIIQKGFLKAEAAAALSRQQIFDYLFEPGFSTKDEVSKISGRGVGLDVVRKSMEKVGGKIEVESTPGLGTTFRLRIPLTLAIIPALIIKCAENVMALPQISIQELVLINKSNFSEISNLRGNPVFRLRKQLLPLVYLADLLELPRQELREGSYIVVMQTGTTRFGLLVDEVLNIQEIVVKPASRLVRDLKVYSGATILGGNDVILILDANGLAQRAKLSGQNFSQNTATDDKSGKGEGEKTSLLIVKQNGGYKAIPLDLVDRLEEIESEQLEFINDKPVVQYRNRVLALHELPQERGEQMRVVVFRHDKRFAGMVVDSFEDVIEQVLDLDDVDAREGSLGATIIQGRSVEVIDVGHYLALSDASVVEYGNASERIPQVLLIESSDFIRQHLRLILRTTKCETHSFPTPADALKSLKGNSKKFDLILLGIDSSGASVNAMHRLLRESIAKDNVPMVAITSNKFAAENYSELFDAFISGFKKTEVLDVVRLALHHNERSSYVTI